MSFRAFPPLFSLAGTHPDELVRQKLDAAEKLELALEALEAAAPNGRDWAARPDLFAQVQEEHRARCAALRLIVCAVRAELEVVVDSIPPARPPAQP